MRDFTDTAWIIVIFLLQRVSSRRKCNYEPTPKSEFIAGVTIDDPTPRLEHRPNFEPIRIFLHYAESFNEYKNSALIKRNVIEPAHKTMEAIIFVNNPTNGILRAKRNCLEDSFVLESGGGLECTIGCYENVTCGGHNVPKSLLKQCKVVADNEVKYTFKKGEGLHNIDIIIIIGAKHCDIGFEASGGVCQLERKIDRPILGHITLCYGQWDGNNKRHNNKLTAEHMFLHALGLSKDVYNYYRNPDGEPFVERNMYNIPRIRRQVGKIIWDRNLIIPTARTRYNIHGEYEKNGYGFVTEFLLTTVREHFNCPTLDAVDLSEDMYHLSEYVFFNDILTPDSNDGMDHISDMTKGFLMDTGWYSVNYANIEYLTYGKHKGCSFVLNGCYKYMEDQKAKNLPIFPFCNKTDAPGKIYNCLENRKVYYYCNLMRHVNFDKKYEYFRKVDGVPNNAVSFYGGLSPDFEYCPTMLLTSDPTSLCNDESNRGRHDYQNILNSYYGYDSLCFENDIWTPDPNKYYGASCQKYEYSKKKKILKIFFDNTMIQCPSKVIHKVSVKHGYDIRFTCPNLINFDEIAIDTVDKLGKRLKEIGLLIQILYANIILLFILYLI